MGLYLQCVQHFLKTFSSDENLSLLWRRFGSLCFAEVKSVHTSPAKFKLCLTNYQLAEFRQNHPRKALSCQRHSLATRRIRILRDGFDSRLQPIAFDIYTRWLLTRRAQAHFAVSLNYYTVRQWHGLAVPRAGDRSYVMGSIRGLSRSHLTYVTGGCWLEERKLTLQSPSITILFVSDMA